MKYPLAEQWARRPPCGRGRCEIPLRVFVVTILLQFSSFGEEQRNRSKLMLLPTVSSINSVPWSIVWCVWCACCADCCAGCLHDADRRRTGLYGHILCVEGSHLTHAAALLHGLFCVTRL